MQQPRSKFLKPCNFAGMQEVRFDDLGSMGYREAWDFQERLLAANTAKKLLAGTRVHAQALPAGEAMRVDAGATTIHHLLFVEHPPVFTLGKSGKAEHILLTPADMAARQVDYFPTNRGGDITFHGPGQLVVYPILDLERFYTDIGRYLRNLEEVVIRTLAAYGLKGERSVGEAGVWLDAAVAGRERKICAIGVRCSRWVTMHGFALNVNTDLDYFGYIIPCGIRGKGVTSMARELGYNVPMADVKQRVKHHFQEVFGVFLVDASPL